MRSRSHHIALLAALLMLPAASMAQQSPAASFEPELEDLATFPDFAGREETFGLCAACHNFRIVAAQGMTREQWDASLAWMTDKHGMPLLEPADRDTILGYLTKAFPPRAVAGGRSGWRSPFSPQQ